MNINLETYKEIFETLLADKDSVEMIEAEPGSLIYSSKHQLGQLILIEAGEVRLIDTSRTFGSYTLIKIEAPAMFGISQLITVPFIEEIRASTFCKCYLIDLNELSEQQYLLVSNILRQQVNPHEIPLIYEEGQNTLTTLSNYNEAKRGLCFFAQNDKLLDGEFLVYLDNEIDGFTFGQRITEEICTTFFKSKEWPRLIRIKNDPLETSYTQPLQNVKPSVSTKEQTEERVDLESIPITPELIPERATKDYKGFRLVRGTNRREVFASCIGMLVQHFELPTRRDTINRAADLLDKDDINWNNRLLSLLDNLGLAVRIVRCKVENPLRMPTPCLWIDPNGMCSIIAGTSAKELILLNPLKGIERLEASQASERLAQAPEVISVEIGLHTPRKRFNLSWLMPYVKRYRLQLIEVFAASFLNQLFALATPLLFQQIIDRVISKGAFDALTPLVILMLTFVILETIFSSLRTFQFVEVSNRIDIGVGSSIVSRMLRINARFFDKRPVGELSSRLGELQNIRRFLTGTALTAVLDAIFSIMYFLVMFFYSPLLTLTVLLTVPLLFLVTVGITPITQRLIRRRAEATSRTQSLLVEILSGIQTIKLQNAELSARRQWEDRHLDSINQGFKAVLANTSSSNALQLINKVSSILIIGIGSWLVLRNELTLGELIAFRIISGYVTQPMLRLASTWQSFQEMSLSLERVGDIVNQPLEISENEEGNIVMPAIKGEITADSVSFSYSSTAAPVLSSVSLNIKAGTFVGIVGQSGCGKSSFLKMIPRLYLPSKGRILIDQYDISKVELYAFRKQIGYVPQDCMLFEGTVFSNIALGDPQAESAKVVKVATIACAHEFIMELPYGYSTPIGEKGAGLSGGQRQRISLARMLLENPNMVVLDEATSALDVDTERQVVTNLREYLSNKTLLMITHRLSTLVDADQIIVMHTGRVDSVGRHVDLMNEKGRYYALYQSQFGEPA